MPGSIYIKSLQEALSARLGCECVHLTCGLVHLKDDQGKTLWRGMVETFALNNHPEARLAYAWGQLVARELQSGEFVLGSAEIDSPAAAVASVLSAGGTTKPAAGLQTDA